MSSYLLFLGFVCAAVAQNGTSPVNETVEGAAPTCANVTDFCSATEMRAMTNSFLLDGEFVYTSFADFISINVRVYGDDLGDAYLAVMWIHIILPPVMALSVLMYRNAQNWPEERMWFGFSWKKMVFLLSGLWVFTHNLFWFMCYPLSEYVYVGLVIHSVGLLYGIWCATRLVWFSNFALSKLAMDNDLCDHCSAVATFAAEHGIKLKYSFSKKQTHQGSEVVAELVVPDLRAGKSHAESGTFSAIGKTQREAKSRVAAQLAQHWSKIPQYNNARAKVASSSQNALVVSTDDIVLDTRPEHHAHRGRAGTIMPLDTVTSMALRSGMFTMSPQFHETYSLKPASGLDRTVMFTITPGTSRLSVLASNHMVTYSGPPASDFSIVGTTVGSSALLAAIPLLLDGYTYNMV